MLMSKRKTLENIKLTDKGNYTDKFRMLYYKHGVVSNSYLYYEY